MNNNNKAWNKNGYKQNETHKETQDKKAAQTSESNVKKQETVEPKVKQTESARDNYRAESNRK